jgi:3-methylcrotonyl-CoA carboxylase alpha subunit
MIAKVIVYDWTRAGAIRRMDAALRDTVILGTTTNLTFLRALIAHPAFARGEVDTTFVETHLDELIPPEDALPDAALIAAALHDLVGAGETQTTSVRPAVPDPWGRADDFRIGG